MRKVLKSLKSIVLAGAKLIVMAVVSPFMLIYLAGDWIVKGIKRVLK
jgi:hypothetical protein